MTTHDLIARLKKASVKALDCGSATDDSLLLMQAWRMIETLQRERDEAVALLRSIPTTPETMVAFIGSNFNSMQAEGWTDTLPAEPTGDLSAVKYSLSVHDLLSAFSWVGLDVAAISTLTKPADRGNT